MNAANVRALVVEDERAWQQILTEILTDAGLTVDIAEDLDLGLSRLRATSHRLAVVDLSLGGGDHHNQDGLSVLEAMRHHDPGCVAILLTGFATVDLAVSALTEHSAYTVLRKEAFRRAEFRELVNRALAEAQPLAAAQPGQDEAPYGSRPDQAPAELALVVEDDAGWRSILSELLVEAGYRPHLCSSFGEARGYLRREKYMVAVVDLSLTGPITSDANLDGYQLLGSTQALGIPTVVVSGVASLEDIERAYTERGIFACVEKQTFERRAFLRIVGEAREAARAGDKIAHLTPREREVLGLVAQGLSNKEIAEALVVSTNTVKRHLKAIFEKLGVHTRAAATAKAISAGVSTEQLDIEASTPHQDAD